MLSSEQVCRSRIKIFSLFRFFPVAPDGTWSCVTQFLEIHEFVKQTKLFFMCQRDGLRSHPAAHGAFVEKTVRTMNGCRRGPLLQWMKLLPPCKPSLHILHSTHSSHISHNHSYANVLHLLNIKTHKFYSQAPFLDFGLERGDVVHQLLLYFVRFL